MFSKNHFSLYCIKSALIKKKQNKKNPHQNPKPRKPQNEQTNKKKDEPPLPTKQQASSKWAS